MKVWQRMAGFMLVAGVINAQASPQAASAEAKMPTAQLGSKSNIVKLEVASSQEEIQRGLMFRTSLPADQGMVFLFHPPQKANFWMCHTLIPLDMLFIKDGKIVHIFEDVPPCKSPNCDNCATYPAGDGLEVSEVLEVNAGYAKQHKLKINDPVTFEFN